MEKIFFENVLKGPFRSLCSDIYLVHFLCFGSWIYLNLVLFLFIEQCGDFVMSRQESVVSLYPQCQVCLLGAWGAVAWSTWAVTVACRQNRANLNILSSWILHNGPPDTKENFQPKILTSDVMSSFFAWYWAYLSWELLFQTSTYFCKPVCWKVSGTEILTSRDEIYKYDW